MARICSKRTSFHGKTGLQASQARTNLAIGGFQMWDSKNPTKSQVWNGRQDERRWTLLLWGGFRLIMKKWSIWSKEGPAQPANQGFVSRQDNQVTPQMLQGLFWRGKLLVYKGYQTQDWRKQVVRLFLSSHLGKEHHFCRFGEPKEQSGAPTWKVQVWQAAPSAPAPSRSVFITPGPEEKMGALCCVEPAQPLLTDLELQGECLVLVLHLAVQQQEQVPDKGNIFLMVLPSTPAEISASHSWSKGTHFRRAHAPQRIRSHRQRATSTSHAVICVVQSLCVVTSALWSLNLGDKEGMQALCLQRHFENVAQSLKDYS